MNFAVTPFLAVDILDVLTEGTRLSTHQNFNLLYKKQCDIVQNLSELDLGLI